MALYLRVDRSKSPGARITVQGSGRTAHSFLGNAMTCRVAVFDEAGAVANLSDHTSLNLSYMPESRTAAATATVTVAIEDATFTTAQWEAGTHYHGEFAFDETDMNPTLSGTSDDFWLVCFGILTGTGYEITHGGGKLTVEEDGTDNTVTPPDPPETGVTAAQVALQIDDHIDGLGYALNNVVATTDPGTGDDSGDGYSVGSMWINLTLDRVWRCTDATLTAAVWKRCDNETAPLNNFVATTNPGVGDDSGDGYSVGSTWVNLTLDRIYRCVDASVGAAVWDRIDDDNVLNKFDGTTAPTVNEDSGDGYAVGSRWIDTTNDKTYECTDASVGAAVWKETSNAATIAAHASQHQSGGSDPIKLDDLATPDDNTDLNASTTRHGLLKKLSNNPLQFMDGQGNWSVPGVIPTAVNDYSSSANLTSADTGDLVDVDCTGGDVTMTIDSAGVTGHFWMRHAAGGNDVFLAESGVTLNVNGTTGTFTLSPNITYHFFQDGGSTWMLLGKS